MELAEIFAALETDIHSEPTKEESKKGCDKPGCFSCGVAARAFIMAGNATFTLVSKKTQARYTFKVSKLDDGDGSFLFVSLLVGPDNWSNFKYFGYLRRGVYFHGGTKAKVGLEAPGQKAFAWAWHQVAKGTIPESLEVWHEGKCGRCGRKLTVPSSIESGFGPECLGKVGL